MLRSALAGVRIQISGSIPDEASPEQRAFIESFVEQFTLAMFREGGSVIHGSHPTLMPALERAGKRIQEGGGSRESILLVRATRYATPAHRTEIEGHRTFALVQIVPSVDGAPMTDLIPMREWMAERCDAVVALGGKWWSQNPQRAGTLAEVEEAMARGKPVFLATGGGGAIHGFVESQPEVLSQLRNGLRPDANRALFSLPDAGKVVEGIVAQLKVLPLAKRNASSKSRFRILALDGGGLRGAFTAAVLAQWNKMLIAQNPNLPSNYLAQHFDLIAGTSTGSILAIGLGLGLKPERLVEFYQSEGPGIFRGGSRLGHLFQSKYSAAPLTKALNRAFGNRTLMDSDRRLVIPTIHAPHGRSAVITTPHTPDRTGFASMSAVDAAKASAAAPTYFNPAQVHSGLTTEEFLDGGLWSNNPALPAIAEAVGPLGVPMEHIDLLSLGTVACELDFREALGDGKLGWATHAVDLCFSAQEHGAEVLATRLLSRARHLRINTTSPKPYDLDDSKVLDELVQRGVEVGRDTFDQVRSRFLDGILVPDWHPNR
jgi:hypothetical protein